jgi:hypothetical protein
MYYYKNKFNEIVFIPIQSTDKSYTYLGSISNEEFDQLLSDHQKPENFKKVITIDSSNHLVLADKPFFDIIPRTINDYWLEISFSRRNNLRFLCRKLKYHYLNDNMSDGIDESRPLIKYNDDIFTIDEARDYINLHQYDDDDHTTKSDSLKTQLIAAKTYIRDHIVEL